MVPDYYTLLGVEPGADRAAIEAALKKCQPMWSSGTRNPKNRHTFQSYLDQIPEIRRTLLGDPFAREAYDAELAAARRAERDRKLDDLQRLIRLRAAKGGLTVSDRNLLRAEAVRLGLTHEDFDRLAELIPPKPDAPPDLDDPPDAPQDALDASMRGQIRVALGHVGKRDLYDALDLPRDAPSSEVAVRADAERQRWMNKSQVTAEKTAWLEVVSYAQSHLIKPEARARYDRTLGLHVEDELNTSISFALHGLTRLDAGTRRILLDEAMAKGISAERAARLIRRVGRAMGVATDSPSDNAVIAPPPRLLRCRSCSGVTEFSRAARDAAAAHCTHCGASLRWECPVCQRSQWVDETRCACKFPLEFREPLVRYFEAAQHSHKVRDYSSALAYLQKVQQFAPHHVGARKGIDKIKERLAEIDQAKTSYQLERSRRHLVAARSALDAWARLVDPTTPELRANLAEVVHDLREAHRLVQSAVSLIESDPTQARNLFRQSLALAADLPEARDGLRRFPPDPPRGLRAEVAPGRVFLEWSSPPPDGLGPVLFRVLRKRAGLPNHSADGEVLAELAATEYLDSTPRLGESFGYAIFSRRNDADSRQCVTSGPHLLLGEVTDVRIEARSGEVDLAWTAPLGAVDVRVVRKIGSPPSGPDDGEVVETLRGHAHDLGLVDDRVYHYGLFARYRAGDGRMKPARGVFVSAKPHRPAAAVSDLTLRSEPDGRILLRWSPPDRGEVRMFRSVKPLGFDPGRRFGSTDSEGWDGQWLSATSPGEILDERPPAATACYYTPFTALNGNLTVGAAAILSSISDPSDLRAVRAGSAGRVHLRWRWSSRSVQSLILARSGRDPEGPHDSAAIRAVVQAHDYVRLGFYPVTLPQNEPGPWYVRIYSIAYIDDEQVVSPGLEPSARTVVPGPDPEVTVSYRLKPPMFPGRRWTLSFRTDPSDSTIPPTVLVAHHRTIPLTADDGHVVDRFPATRDGGTFKVSTELSLSEYRLRIFADPTADPDTLSPIRFRHPEIGSTRV
jgi:hypothetical protein